jgi:zinc/manganese transport system substrate-binding protein
MKRIVVLMCALLWAAGADAALKIFACEPEWGALAHELGGHDVDVFTATTALQDVHHIQARPSLIARLRKADLLVCTGAGLEVGWLPVLLQRAGNPHVQPGAAGNLVAADSVTLLNKPERVDRSEGDVHPDGNPHFHLDARNMLPVAATLADRLAELDAAHAPDYAQRLEDFNGRWRAALKKWEAAAAPLRDMPVVVHHDAWVYLNDWIGLRQVGILEPKPGVPPTSAHLSRLLKQLRQTPARAVIRASYQDARAAGWLSGKAGIPAVELPYSVGADERSGDLFGLFDTIIAELRAVP